MSLMPEIKVLNKEDYLSSTIVLKGSFSTKIDINILSRFLIIENKFDNKNKRIKLISGSRKHIEFYGPEKAIVSIGYKNIRRGMRTGAMNNMVSIDMQLGGKNIHIKVSSTSITNVGTSTKEAGKKVFLTVIDHINILQNYLEYSNSLTYEEKEKNINWLLNEIKNFDKDIRRYELENKLKIPKELNEKYIKFLLNYYDDFDNEKDFNHQISLTKENLIMCEEKLTCDKFEIYNSVYHTQPINNPNFRMPLHKLGPFLANLGVSVSWHNALSEGLNIVFDIEEEKQGNNKDDRYYKHRFTIYITSKIKQTSPTNKDEAYKYYIGLMNLLKMFFKEEKIDYKKYITKDNKINDNVKILLKSKETVLEKIN